MSNASKNSKSFTIEDVFKQLDKWRHLPNYQLERRVDIFFALFLPEVLGKCIGVKINPLLVPEFPIKEEKNNRSKKADYFAISEDGERAFLIELKTDTMSVYKNQIESLKCAARRGIVKMISGVIAIAKSESVAGKRQIRGKYFHLLRDLRELGLVEIPNFCDFENLLFKDGFTKKKYECYIKNMEIGKRPKLEVVYIIPKKPQKILTEYDIRQMDFGDFSEYARSSGPIGSRFAKSLDCWKEQAGLCLPQS